MINSPAVRTVAFLLLGPPALVAGVVPGLLSGWRIEEAFFGWQPWRWVGIACLAAGGLAAGDSMVRFAWRGRGTPAPWSPPERFVATGLYRFVRNPMYLGVLGLIVGQGLLFGSIRVLLWGGSAAVGFHLFVLFYEEPALRRRFGATYDAYRRDVPRWRPRIRPRTTR